MREIQELTAAEGASASALLTARLEQIVSERKTYERAGRRALARLREGLDLQWAPAVHAPSFTNDDRVGFRRLSYQAIPARIAT